MSDVPSPSTYVCGAIRLLVGLEPIRLRPGMYIGPLDNATACRLGAVAVAGMVRSGTAANNVIAEIRDDGSLTVRAASALTPMDTHHRDGIEQPALLDMMLSLPAGEERAHGWLDGQGCMLAALSAPLGVSCRQNGVRLDAWFSRGGLAQPIRVSQDPRPDATAIGLAHDPAVLKGTMDLEGLRRELIMIDPEATAYARLEHAQGDFWSVLGSRL